MSIKRDIVAGLFFTAVGLCALVIALKYSFGSTFRMGPGFFPTIVAGLIFVFGAALTVRTIRDRKSAAISEIAWRPLIIIFIAVVGFGLLIERAGMLPALAFLVVAGWYANPGRSLRLLPLQLALGILVPVAIFKLALGMPIPLWRF